MAKIIEPKFEIITPIDGLEVLKTIERIARTCYKSENLITEDGASAKKIIKLLIESEHDEIGRSHV